MAVEDVGQGISPVASPNTREDLPAKGLSSQGSLGKRYFFKLSSNFATIPLYLLMEMILPRALGPAAYGNFNFVTTMFQNVINFLDMGTSTCLNTTLAKRPSEFGLISFYLRIGLLMLLLCVLSGLCLLMPGLGEALMPGVPAWMALPAALWAYLTWAGRVARGVNDAMALTLRSEMVRLGLNLIAAAALLGLYLWGALDLEVFFLHQYTFLLLTLAGFCLTLKGSWPGGSWKLDWREMAAYAREFKGYSMPLMVMSLATLLAVFGERWLLQFFEGSSEQGYFSLSVKIGMACFLFVGAMIPLLMRELSLAHGKSDPSAMARLLDRFAPMLYGVAACLSCFTFAEAAAFTRLFGGSEFTGAVAAVQIMALYPMHQSYGQVAAAVYYASGETRRLRNITVAFLAIGLGMALVLLAPKEQGGLELGAEGLALKMVLVQAITVNVMLFLCRREAPFRFGRNLAHQILCPAVLLALAFIARYLSGEVAQLDGFLRLAVSCFIYLGSLSVVAAVFPFLIGLTRPDLRRITNRAVKGLRFR